ncbi:MAG: molybdopterin molybdotransferase MoeA [Gammaproteobacteria bacterium]|nr:molybdopterin molybdotransferase MoeA [Gammaproteobacteria bacterium]MDH3576476.1 molybdopterin molybdotransferase MoeA [Gammaproteobacteria bacterium]
MLTTAEAREAVLAAMRDFPAEATPVDDANERVLRQVVRAERDQPPFDRVMMDGIALACADLGRGVREFPVQATQAAGDPVLSLQPGGCIEIMTGASLPENADCIVPVERISVKNGIAIIEDGYEARSGQFIHPRASDHAAGTHLLSPGKRISPMDIAIIASCGLTEVEVSRQPVVRVISTGNELVPPGAPIEAHQVRLSNGPAIQAMLRERGYTNCDHDHLLDDLDELRERIAAHLAEADVLILSGGVSMGKADFVPGVMAELGVNVVFHKVSQRPGKPMWFGIGPNEEAVFALPGNPVSALVCCRQYVIPALAAASAATPLPPEFAVLAGDITFEPDLTCFQPVRLVSSAAGQVLAMPVKTNTSGDFTALSATDGYVELAREQSHFPAGTPVFLHRWRAG